ncbi:MAG: hypothetical protein AB3N16_07995 [Flavobacteriaceae bacterium]
MLVPLALLTGANYYKDYEIKSHKAEMAYLRKANEILVNQQNYAGLDINKLELSVWKKLKIGGDFVMVWLSSKYDSRFLQMFGIPANNYLGQTDYHIWPEKLADEFWEEDMQVALTGEDLYGIGNSPDGKKLLIRKWRVIEGNSVYVMGMAIDKDEAKDWFKK